MPQSRDALGPLLPELLPATLFHSPRIMDAAPTAQSLNRGSKLPAMNENLDLPMVPGLVKRPHFDYRCFICDPPPTGPMDMIKFDDPSKEGDTDREE